MRALAAALAVCIASHPCMAAVYDRAITVFSPDGKLMQVAYADEAVKRGNLAVAASNGRDSIVMCLERPDPTASNASPSASSFESTTSTMSPRSIVQEHEYDDRDVGVGEHAAGGDGIGGRHRRGRSGGGVRDQGVVVGIVDSVNNQDRKLCEIDDGVFLAFSGISADGRVLASKIRLECQSYRYSMGAAPSVGYIARYIGGIQHRYTRTGGARPYGVACLVAGFDEDTSHPCVFRSEPSGAFAEWTASAVGKGSEKALGRLESVPDLGDLDWRGTAEAAVKAVLAGGAEECDVLVLRREVDRGQPQGSEAPAPLGTEEGRLGVEARGAWVGSGWRNRGGGAWSKWFVGSVGLDGTLALDEEPRGMTAA